MRTLFVDNKKIFAVISIFLVNFDPQVVDGAECNAATSLSCEATVRTLAACDAGTKVCSCQTGFEPVPTGCAKSLSKPSVMLSLGRTKYVVDKTQATLTCVTADTDVTDFSWERNGQTIPNEISKSLTITEASTDKLGTFRCKVSLDGLKSAQSDDVKLEVVPASLKMTTTVLNLPESAAMGVELTPVCGGIPYGTEYRFQIDDQADIASSTKITLTSTAKVIKCVVDGADHQFQSVNLPAVAEDIKEVWITPGPNVIRATGSEVTFWCLTKPAKTYMDVDNRKVSFTFKLDGKDTTSSENEYKLTSKQGQENSHSISCEAKYKDAKAISSANVNVTFSDDYIPTPSLEASGSKLVAGSRLVLTCGQPLNNVAYSWMKNNTSILRQDDRIIQIGNFQSKDAVQYSCSAWKDMYQTPWAEVSVELADTLEKPSVVINPTDIHELGDYDLNCVTASFTVGMNFAWLKDNATIPTVVKTYRISRASAARHNGTYTCQARFGNLKSETSDSFEITVLAAGKRCAAATAGRDCTGAGYMGTCNNSSSRCDCSTGYTPAGLACQRAQGMALISSAILVLVAANISYLM